MHKNVHVKKKKKKNQKTKIEYPPDTECPTTLFPLSLVRELYELAYKTSKTISC